DLGADTWYFQPEVPAPVMLADVVQTADALADAAITQHPELAARFPDPSAPKDIVWTSPGAIIDPKAIREALHRSDSSATPPRLQVTTPWYNDTFSLIDVVYEREERLPDGTFGNRAIVEPIPGQTTFRPRLQGQPDAALRNDLLAKLTDRMVQQQVLQPDFL